jgi:hypothetical protein
MVTPTNYTMSSLQLHLAIPTASPWQQSVIAVQHPHLTIGLLGMTVARLQQDFALGLDTSFHSSTVVFRYASSTVANLGIYVWLFKPGSNSLQVLSVIKHYFTPAENLLQSHAQSRIQKRAS